MAASARRPARPVASAPTPSAATERAVRASRDQWHTDLKSLLNNASDRFADVSWRAEGDAEVIYGHKAILYARANASFQMKFLNPNGNARLQAIMSGSNFSLPSSLQPPPTSPLTPSSLSNTSSRAGSPYAQSFRSLGNDKEAAVADSHARTITLHGTERAFFKALLDYLYTASTDIGEVFTFLFEDDSFALSKEEALDRLSQDLLFAWRSKLFADVQIQLSDVLGDIPDSGALSVNSQDDEDHLDSETLFSTHRAILSVRCPYFSSIFLSPYSDTESTLYTLPSPPFTPAALHFVLAYIYTGSLSLPRTFDLNVAMQIYRCASYLSMDLLRTEITCRISDMCHSFQGCCKTCRTRSVRAFAFSNEPDVNDTVLQASSKPILVNYFGEVWDKEVGELPYTVQKEILLDLCSSTTTMNAAEKMKGICMVRNRLASSSTSRPTAWQDHLQSMLIPLEDRIKHLLRYDFPEISTSASFIDLLEGIGFSNDVLETLLLLLVSPDCLSEKTVTMIYEALVGKVLLREEGLRMDARARVEDARVAILAYIKKRWVGIRGLDGFGKLENWCLKELSDELEQPVEDLLNTLHDSRPTTKTGLRLTTTKSAHKGFPEDTHSSATGPASLRASVLNRNAARKSTTSTVSTSTRTNTLGNRPNAEGANGSSATTTSRRTSAPNPAVPAASSSSPRPRISSGSSAIAARHRVTSANGSDVRAKTPSRAAAALPTQISPDHTKAAAVAPPTTPQIPPELESDEGQLKSCEKPSEALPPAAAVTRPSATSSSTPRTRTTSQPGNESGRPKSSVSVRTSASTGASTARRIASSSDSSTPTTSSATSPAGLRTVRTTGVTPRRSLPAHTTGSGTAVIPASTSTGRSVSITSTRSRSASNSNTSVDTLSSTSPAASKRVTKPSNASTRSQRPASAASVTSGKSLAAVKRPASVASVTSIKTATSVRSNATATGAASVRRPMSVTASRGTKVKVKDKENIPPLPKGGKTSEITAAYTKKANINSPTGSSPDQGTKGKAPEIEIVEPAVATASSSPSKRRFSLPGSMLRVGIPCVVTVTSTSSIKFRATVRYVGEVLFDQGKDSWVGVEVGEADSQGKDRQDWKWNDGSVDGIKYFELESCKSTSPLVGRLQAREDKKRSGRTSTDGRRTPVPGIDSPVGPTRGLFVHPSQVLYVF